MGLTHPGFLRLTCFGSNVNQKGIDPALPVQQSTLDQGVSSSSRNFSYITVSYLHYIMMTQGMQTPLAFSPSALDILLSSSLI